MTSSTISAKDRKSANGKPTKPYKDFPLFPHATGRWAKKIRGKLHYFGYWRDQPNDGWKEALARYQDQRDDLHAGRTPRLTGDGLTVRDLCNRFLTAKQHQCDCGEITARTFVDYRSTTDRIVAVFGRTRLVNDLACDDFETLRNDIAKTRRLVSLGNEIQRTRVVFKYGYDAGLIDSPIRYGPTFKRPSKRALRRERNGNGTRMFEAMEIRSFLGAASRQLKAMILLGVNCGFGNHDVGRLPRSAVDLEAGWIDFPRPKTGIHRRCPLWPETVEAIEAAIASRPEPKEEIDADLVFVTSRGGSWAKETSSNPVSAEFRKLIKSIDAKAAKEGTDRPLMYRKGVGFYALRHVFETIGGESRDQAPVDHIMGHARDDMASAYREWISDDRLQSVTYHVHAWLYGNDDDGKESANEARGGLRVFG